MGELRDVIFVMTEEEVEPEYEVEKILAHAQDEEVRFRKSAREYGDLHSLGHHEI